MPSTWPQTAVPDELDGDLLERFVQGDQRVRIAVPAVPVGRLPPKLQVVATLALVEEQPYAEIADALGLPVGTVTSRVFRATRMLREELARLGVRP